MSREDYDIMAHVEEEANHLPTPAAQYGPVGVSNSDSSAAEKPPRYAYPRRRSLHEYYQLPAAVEAAEERPPLAPLQQIHERTHNQSVKGTKRGAG
jgi:hypothetical protein